MQPQQHAEIGPSYILLPIACGIYAICFLLELIIPAGKYARTTKNRTRDLQILNETPPFY